MQRRLSLIGDGIGHVALTGVGVGLLLHQSPVLTAVIVAAIGAIGVELVRERGRTSGDLALALLFYGGIAGGVVLVGLLRRQQQRQPDAVPVRLADHHVAAATCVVIAVLGVAVLLAMLLLRPVLFAVCHDEEYARVSGLPVRTLNLLLAVTTAVTVTIAMRTVGSAAGQRADGGAGGGRPAGHPRLPQHDGARRWRSALVAAGAGDRGVGRDRTPRPARPS